MTSYPARERRLFTGVAILAILFVSNACGGAVRSSPEPAHGSDNADARALETDIRFLASDALEGRGTGTVGNDSAAAYIARRFASLRLQPLGTGFEQHFVAHPLAAHRADPVALPTENVVGRLPGTDSSLRGEFVLVGAHFDHLGRSTEGALDPDRKNVIRHGADDNASGTAAVLELARLFATR